MTLNLKSSLSYAAEKHSRNSFFFIPAVLGKKGGTYVKKEECQENIDDIHKIYIFILFYHV